MSAQNILRFPAKMFKTNQLILVTLCVMACSHKINRKYSEEGPIFDFIVVGGGTAGAVVANRLSEENHWNVLLLEAGKEPSNDTDVPAYAIQFQFTEFNWNYTMEKQDNMALGMTDQRINFPRGKVLGGSSILNFMLYTRGNREDYDRWERDGNPGWSYEDVLPYFKKSEDYHVKHQDREYHSRGGYLAVEDVSYRSECSHTFVNALQESGYKFVDYNGKQQTGVSYVHASTRNGRRSSSVRAFLDPIRHRSNLRITTEATVTKLIITRDKTVVGVRGVRKGVPFVAYATKEVILSAGALNSPQILMLSGIGPRDELKKHGIPLVKDSPVGRRLYDHPCYLGLTFLINTTGVCIDPTLFGLKSSLKEWKENHVGPLTSTAGTEALAYVRTNVSKHAIIDFPDVEFAFLGMGQQADNGTQVRKSFRISDEMYNAYWKPYEGTPSFTVIVLLMRPNSFGNVTLKSSKPNDYPKFYGNYFTDADGTDMRTMIAGIRKAVETIHNAPAFKKYNARLVEKPVPGCESLKQDSDAYWECAVRTLTGSTFHQSSTCRMGPDCDSDAVLDYNLKVKGVKGLRVIDASVMPSPVTAHINAPTYMIAEKGSDLIKLDNLFNNIYQ